MQDEIELVTRVQTEVSVANVWRYAFSQRADEKTTQLILQLPMLPDFWKDRVRRLPAIA